MNGYSFVGARKIRNSLFGVRMIRWSGLGEFVAENTSRAAQVVTMITPHPNSAAARGSLTLVQPVHLGAVVCLTDRALGRPRRSASPAGQCRIGALGRSLRAHTRRCLAGPGLVVASRKRRHDW